MVEIFMCKDCPLCEDYEYRLKVMEKGFPLQTEYCSCDKVGTYFYNGGYCEDALEKDNGERKARAKRIVNKKKKDYYKFKKKKELIKNKGYKINQYLSDDETYIKSPKNSKQKKRLKKQSNKIIRKNKNIFNYSGYRKVFDYAWKSC